MQQIASVCAWPAPRLNLDGGILRTTRNENNFLSGFAAPTLGANGVWFDGNGLTLGVLTSFSGTGGLTKRGTGQLTLTGTNTYSGATYVQDGTLYINGSGAMSAASHYTIAIARRRSTATPSSPRPSRLARQRRDHARPRLLRRHRRTHQRPRPQGTFRSQVLKAEAPEGALSTRTGGPCEACFKGRGWGVPLSFWLAACVVAPF